MSRLTITQALTIFLMHRFPWWGVCHLHLDRDGQTLQIHCFTAASRDRIMQDSSALSQMDIGLHSILLVCEACPTVMIRCRPHSMS